MYLYQFYPIQPKIKGFADLYFAGLRDKTENDMHKYLLSELIRNAQALLDKIQEYDKLS